MLQRGAAGGSSICWRGDGPVLLQTQSLELHVDVSADAEQRQQQTTHTRPHPAAAQRVHLSIQLEASPSVYDRINRFCFTFYNASVTLLTGMERGDEESIKLYFL